MAVSEGRELKLNSRVLTELEDVSSTKQRQSWVSLFKPTSNSFPAFSSPVESEIGSTEIESDKEDDCVEDDDDFDYTAELSRRMAQYMLQDDDNQCQPISRFTPEKQSKSWGLSASPISTLWSPLGSSQGSPEGPSKEPSPPTTPIVAGDRCLEIPLNVFSKLEKMSLNLNIDGTENFISSETTKSIQMVLEDGLTGIIPNQDSSSEDHVRGPQVPKRKQQHKGVKQTGSAIETKHKQAQGFSSNLCQTLTEQNKSDQRKPIFPSGSGLNLKNGPSGTGVFLPRHTNNNRATPTPAPPNPQPKKKKGCSTVLIPMRVLHALQLHHERMDAESRQKHGAFPLNQEALVGMKNGMYAVKKSHLKSAEAPSTSQNDVGLPQEWTY